MYINVGDKQCCQRQFVTKHVSKWLIESKTSVTAEICRTFLYTLAGSTTFERFWCIQVPRFKLGNIKLERKSLFINTGIKITKITRKEECTRFHALVILFVCPLYRCTRNVTAILLYAADDSWDSATEQRPDYDTENSKSNNISCSLLFIHVLVYIMYYVVSYVSASNEASRDILVPESLVHGFSLLLGNLLNINYHFMVLCKRIYISAPIIWFYANDSRGDASTRATPATLCPTMPNPLQKNSRVTWHD